MDYFNLHSIFDHGVDPDWPIYVTQSGLLRQVKHRGEFLRANPPQVWASRPVLVARIKDYLETGRLLSPSEFKSLLDVVRDSWAFLDLEGRPYRDHLALHEGPAPEIVLLLIYLWYTPQDTSCYLTQRCLECVNFVKSFDRQLSLAPDLRAWMSRKCLFGVCYPDRYLLPEAAVLYALLSPDSDQQYIVSQVSSYFLTQSVTWLPGGFTIPPGDLYYNFLTRHLCDTRLRQTCLPVDFTSLAMSPRLSEFIAQLPPVYEPKNLELIFQLGDLGPVATGCDTYKLCLWALAANHPLDRVLDVLNRPIEVSDFQLITIQRLLVMRTDRIIEHHVLDDLMVHLLDTFGPKYFTSHLDDQMELDTAAVAFLVNYGAIQVWPTSKTLNWLSFEIPVVPICFSDFEAAGYLSRRDHDLTFREERAYQLVLSDPLPPGFPDGQPF